MTTVFGFLPVLAEELDLVWLGGNCSGGQFPFPVDLEMCFVLNVVMRRLSLFDRILISHSSVPLLGYVSERVEADVLSYSICRSSLWMDDLVAGLVDPAVVLTLFRVRVGTTALPWVPSVSPFTRNPGRDHGRDSRG